MWRLCLPHSCSWDIKMMWPKWRKLFYFLLLACDFKTEKVTWWKHTISLLVCNGEILKKTKCHTVTFCNISNGIVVVWLEASFRCFQKSALRCLIPSKSGWEKNSSLQETNFEQDFFKFFMSHYQIGSLWKRYKITFSVITFLFANRFQVWDMQKFRSEMGYCWHAKKL